MPPTLADVVTSEDPAVRDLSIEAVVAGRSAAELLREAAALEALRRADASVYRRVRALFLLAALHREHLPPRLPPRAPVRHVPAAAHADLCARRFEPAIDALLALQAAHGPSDAWSSALAAAYRERGFEMLAGEVRASVRAYEGNRWTFEVERPEDHPLRVRPELLAGDVALREATPVRLDLSHAAWSDLFFLAMDRPEAASVVNASIALAVHGVDPEPRPPVEARFSVIDRPVLRLASVDLEARAELEALEDVFDLARDHLGLLKAAAIASGLVPPSLEGSGASLGALLERLVGPGRGIELETAVRGVPKGSRLAVSTTLLASLIAVAMRATGQTARLDGPLAEHERRLVAARAILGEWLGGSGGGWQDSGGLWPGLKRIRGALARPGDPEHGRSRGRLLPEHELLGHDRVPAAARRRLAESLVLVHGGMAQDVGPILRMVTERYLLRSRPEWSARGRALALQEEILDALGAGDVRRLGRATTETFLGPLRTILPWVSNPYVERAIERCEARFGRDFLGFWMLGGMAGGGMGFLFEPRARDAARAELLAILRAAKRELEHGVPFAIDPVAYDFAVDERGSRAARVAAAARPEAPRARGRPRRRGPGIEDLLERLGFDREQHERIRADLIAGRIGLARNRLPEGTPIEDARPGDVVDARAVDPGCEAAGRAALARGTVAVVTLAGGLASRWSGGAGVVKALAPVAPLGGHWRSFLDVHRAKARRRAREAGAAIPHVVTTSWLTHDALAAHVAGLADPPILSPGRAVGLRLVPMERDLAFAWEAARRPRRDEREERVLESRQAALRAWARAAGEGSDDSEGAPELRLHPVGHAYEVLNLVVNGTLARLLARRPALSTLLVHNVDALGADVDPALYGLFLESGAALAFEVVPRRFGDAGGGLARVGGRLRIVESLALPREEDELGLSFYNSMTTWIDVDSLLALLGLERSDLAGDAGRPDGRLAAAARALAERLPAYVTLKDQKRRFGRGQEDVFPLCQYERLWSDVTALPDARVAYLAVPRVRGEQLKEPAQLDAWWRDGSAAHVAAACGW